jgi:hypothetical protein
MHPEPDRNLARRRLARHRALLGAGIVVGLVVGAFVIEALRSPEGHGASSAASVPAPAVPAEPDSEQRQANAPAPGPTPARIASTPERATGTPSLPQPPAATNITTDLPPLAQRIDELTRRADAGDVVASCMLGAELLQCAERRRLRGWLRSIELGPWATDQLKARVPATRDTLARLERHCAGVPAARGDEAPRRLFDAADRGNGAAASLAVLFGEQWIYTRLMTEPDLVARLRDGYPRWVDAVLQAQDLEAATGIVRSAMLGHPQDLALQALGRDGVALRALDLALVRIASETGEDYGDMPSLRLAQSEAALDADARARAEVLGQRWYDALMRFPDPDTEPDVDADADAATDIAHGELSWERIDRARVDALHERCARG